MKKRPLNRAQIFKGQYYAVDEDADSGELTVVFTEDRTMVLVRFALLEQERHRFSDEAYVNGLISAYHRNPGQFAQKRKVSAG